MANATNNKNNSKPTTTTNRPAPGRPPTNGATAKLPTPVAVQPSDDLGDDDLDTAPTGGKKDDSFSKLPPAKRVSVRLGNEVQRLTRQAESISNWPGDALLGIRSSLSDALTNLKLAAEGLASLPDDYKPRVAKASSKGWGSKELKAGDKVRITDKRVAEYEGVLEPELMRGIEVVELRGNKVIAKTSDGMRAMFARGHVCLDEEATA